MRTRRVALAVAATVSMIAMPMAAIGQDATDVDGSVFSGWVEPGPAVPGGFAPTWDVDEPRLMGDATWASRESTVDGGRLRHITWRIENDGGAWQASYRKVIWPEDVHSGVTAVFVGEGGYDGLLAIIELDSNQGFGWAVRGMIIEAADLPEAPPAAG